MVNWKRVFGALAFPTYLCWYGWFESDLVGTGLFMVLYLIGLVTYILGRGKYFEY